MKQDVEYLGFSWLRKQPGVGRTELNMNGKDLLREEMRQIFIRPQEARGPVLELIQTQWERVSPDMLRKLEYDSREQFLSDARDLLREAAE